MTVGVLGFLHSSPTTAWRLQSAQVQTLDYLPDTGPTNGNSPLLFRYDHRRSLWVSCIHVRPKTTGHPITHTEMLRVPPSRRCARAVRLSFTSAGFDALS
jgi:hypothetical protein